MARYVEEDPAYREVDDRPGGGAIVASNLIRYAAYIAITLIIVFFLVWLIEDSGVL